MRGGRYDCAVACFTVSCQCTGPECVLIAAGTKLHRAYVVGNLAVFLQEKVASDIGYKWDVSGVSMLLRWRSHPGAATQAIALMTVISSQDVWSLLSCSCDPWLVLRTGYRAARDVCTSRSETLLDPWYAVRSDRRALTWSARATTRVIAKLGRSQGLPLNCRSDSDGLPRRWTMVRTRRSGKP